MKNENVKTNEEPEMMPFTFGMSKEPSGRDLYVFGEIGDGMISTVVLPILKFNKEDEKLKVREPINIYIHSQGGDTWVTFAIIDAILKSETPVNTICLGYAASGGFYILCAGHNRSAMMNSSLMVHTATWGISGKAPVMRSNMVELNNIEKKLIRFLEQKTLINEKDFKNLSGNEWWMTSEEALEYMVIDTII